MDNKLFGLRYQYNPELRRNPPGEAVLRPKIVRILGSLDRRVPQS